MKPRPRCTAAHFTYILQYSILVSLFSFFLSFCFHVSVFSVLKKIHACDKKVRKSKTLTGAGLSQTTLTERYFYFFFFFWVPRYSTLPLALNQAFQSSKKLNPLNPSMVMAMG
ncbi:hypothetical protein DFH27DRAFT_246349 [Peziza echinospora]|nr:hypothetical protein DFH27DRAFT_246349 [Peziza echinospora]